MIHSASRSCNEAFEGVGLLNQPQRISDFSTSAAVLATKRHKRHKDMKRSVAYFLCLFVAFISSSPGTGHAGGFRFPGDTACFHKASDLIVAYQTTLCFLHAQRL